MKITITAPRVKSKRLFTLSQITQYNETIYYQNISSYDNVLQISLDNC